jgi:hypothetical protein
MVEDSKGVHDVSGLNSRILLGKPLQILHVGRHSSEHKAPVNACVVRHKHICVGTIANHNHSKGGKNMSKEEDTTYLEESLICLSILISSIA